MKRGMDGCEGEEESIEKREREREREREIQKRERERRRKGGREERRGGGVSSILRPELEGPS